VNRDQPSLGHQTDWWVMSCYQMFWRLMIKASIVLRNVLYLCIKEQLQCMLMFTSKWLVNTPKHIDTSSTLHCFSD